MTINVSSLGGGGFAVPINGLSTIAAGAQNPYTDASGQVYLVTGTLETDTASYPDAFVNTVPEYSGINFDVSAQISTQISGITFDGTNLWALSGSVDDTVYEYTTAGTYTGSNFSVAAEDSTMNDITWDGTHFWLVGNATNVAYKYDAAGVYTGTSFSVASETVAPTAIEFIDNQFYVSGTDGADRKVWIYDSAGVYTGTNFSIGDQLATGTAQGIASDGTSIFIVENTLDRIYVYSLNGIYTGVFVEVNSIDTEPAGLTFDGTDFYMAGQQNLRVYTFDAITGVGFPNLVTDSDSGLVRYIRIA